jgi:hypothetical protein
MMVGVKALRVPEGEVSVRIGVSARSGIKSSGFGFIFLKSIKGILHGLV